MSKKPQQLSNMNIPDSESDRRLRPVINALYSRNTKQATKLVSQALQKRPGWPAARALRACIYLQQHRWDEAQAEVNDIRRQMESGVVIVNEDGARKLMMYYQEIRREDLAAQVYEMVWKRTKGADAIRMAEMAYCLYIRGNSFSNAQKLATKLHRITGGTSSSSSSSTYAQRYVFWATAALWLGVTYQSRSNLISSNNQQMDARMLKLGCAMMSKALSASSVPPNAETVRFAMRVFKQAGEYDAAIQLVSNPRLVMDDVEVLHLRGDIAFASTKDVTDYQTLLTQHVPNDWGYWLRYCESLKHQHIDDDWTDEALDFVHKVLNLGFEQTRKEPLRGPYLAKMEILSRRSEWDVLGDTIVDYFDKFGSKTVVSRDLRPWMTVLAEQEGRHHDVLDRLETVIGKYGFLHHLHLCWLKLWFNRLHESVDELVQRYIEQRVADLEPTDRQPGDDYLLLAAHKLLPLASPMMTAQSKETNNNNIKIHHGNGTNNRSGNDLKDHDDDYEGNSTNNSDKHHNKNNSNNMRYNDVTAVLKTIMLLESGLMWSPNNYDFKLLLMRLYEVLGGVDKMAVLWESLNVKHVQLSTLSHLVLGPFFDAGHHQPLQVLIEHVDLLWREIEREIPECTTRALQDGSLNAGVDFVLFKLRLERSAILAETMVTDAHLQVLLTGGEPIGVRRALETLFVQSKFSLGDFNGLKRIVANEDEGCYAFWDFDQYEKEQRLAALTQDDVEEDQGRECRENRRETIRANFASLAALLRLTEQNGTDIVQGDGNEKEEDGHATLESMVSDEMLGVCRKSSGGGVSKDVALRLNVARNLVDLRNVLQVVVGGSESSGGGYKQKGNRGGKVDSRTSNGEIREVEIEERIKSLVQSARELVRQVGQLCKEAVGDEVANANEEDKNRKNKNNNNKDHSSDVQNEKVKFPYRLRECCKVAFNVLLLMGIAVSSFSPLLVKGMRKVKKVKSSGDVNATNFSIENFESARDIVLTYRDEIMAATVRIQEWVTTHIDEGVNWVERVFEDEGVVEQVLKLIPDEMQTAPTITGEPTTTGENESPTSDSEKPMGETTRGSSSFDLSQLCKDVTVSIRSSHSVSCSALLESLTSVTRRLHLADL